MTAGVFLTLVGKLVYPHVKSRHLQICKIYEDVENIVRLGMENRWPVFQLGSAGMLFNPHFSRRLPCFWSNMGGQNATQAFFVLGSNAVP